MFMIIAVGWYSGPTTAAPPPVTSAEHDGYAGIVGKDIDEETQTFHQVERENLWGAWQHLIEWQKSTYLSNYAGFDPQRETEVARTALRWEVEYERLARGIDQNYFDALRAAAEDSAAAHRITIAEQWRFIRWRCSDTSTVRAPVSRLAIDTDLERLADFAVQTGANQSEIQASFDLAISALHPLAIAFDDATLRAWEGATTQDIRASARASDAASLDDAMAVFVEYHRPLFEHAAAIRREQEKFFDQCARLVPVDRGDQFRREANFIMYPVLAPFARLVQYGESALRIENLSESARESIESWRNKLSPTVDQFARKSNDTYHELTSDPNRLLDHARGLARAMAALTVDAAPPPFDDPFAEWRALQEEIKVAVVEREKSLQSILTPSQWRRIE